MATQKACYESGANLLSLLAVSGCSAKPNESLMARLFMGAVIAVFRKRFSRRQILFLLLCTADVDRLTRPWESPPRRAYLSVSLMDVRIWRRATSARQRPAQLRRGHEAMPIWRVHSDHACFGSHQISRPQRCKSGAKALMGWMMLPVRLDIPFAAASNRRRGVRRALEPGGRIILARAAAS